MNINELTDRVGKLANAWENFKLVNDQKLKEIERKNRYDPLHDEQLQKMNDDIDYQKDRLSKIEVIMSRPGRSGILTKDANAHELAFNTYLRKGIESNLLNIETKALSVGSNDDGGYFVTSNISSNITRAITEISPMRKLADIETISTDSLDIIEDYGSLDSGWTSETSSIIETSTPRILKKKIPVHELYAQPKATQKLIDDANIDIEKWLGEKLIISFSNMENNAFINGDGEGKPRGILSYSDGRNWGEIEQIKYRLNSTITAEALFDLYFSLKDQYVNRATFLMHKTSIQKVRMLKDKNNQYLWYPGLDRASPATLLGLPVESAVDMPVADDNDLTMVLADFKSAYKIVDRVGIKTLRDPFTDKPFVKFYSTKRVGGDVTNYEAIKILSCSNIEN